MVLMVANTKVPKELFIGGGSEGEVVVGLVYDVAEAEIESGSVVVAVLGGIVVTGVVELLLILLADKSFSRNPTAILLSQEQ